MFGHDRRIVDLISLSHLYRLVISRRRRFLKWFSRYIVLFFLLLLLSHLYIKSFFLSSTYNTVNIEKNTSFVDFIPADRFDLFWAMWNTPSSTFRGRQLLVLESIFIHHPNATVIMFSSILNDTKLFAPFRQRGYRIYSFNISLQHMINWHWYTNNQTKDFLQNWNTSGPYFYSHVSDYLRTIALYLYGGTYLDMDALILQPLPQHEFIGLDDSGAGDKCVWCIKNTSGQYLAPDFMRFRPGRKVLRYILENVFNRDAYDPTCFNCVGTKPYTLAITRFQDQNDAEIAHLQFLQPHRLYPYTWSNAYDIFHITSYDTPLQLADLMKRSYSLHLFGHMTDKFAITQGSLIDLLFHRFDLGDLRPLIPEQNEKRDRFSLIHPSLYIHNPRKQGRFIGRDVIYLRLNHNLANDNVRWAINMRVSNGTILLPSQRPLFNLNQAQVNTVLNQMSYKPFKSTSIDKLIIEVKSDNVMVNCTVKILVFSQWVTVVTKIMGTVDRWPAVHQLAGSVARYYPQTCIHIASDSGKDIDLTHFLNFTSWDGIRGYDLREVISMHNLPEDAGLSKGRNYLVNITLTPFFFLLDDDSVFDEDSHLDILLELIFTYKHIDILAGKVPEDIRQMNDWSGMFLQYNRTLELVYNVSDTQEKQLLFPHLFNPKLDVSNPCRQVNFVSNVFMGRTERVNPVGWNGHYKIGEHEDFFLRMGYANRTVYTCRYINIHHSQIAWWKMIGDPYYKKRTRVYGYMRKMLMNRNLKRMVTFGQVTSNID